MNPLLKQLTAFSITSTDCHNTSRGREKFRYCCARPSAIGERFAVMPSLHLKILGLSYNQVIEQPLAYLWEPDGQDGLDYSYSFFTDDLVELVLRGQ